MFRRILVPTDGSEQAFKSLQYAIGWAKEMQGVIVSLYVIDIKLLEGPLFRDVGSILEIAPLTNYQNQIQSLLEERGKKALNISEAECIKNNIPCEKILQIGIVSTTILEQSELCDIVIMGKSGEHARWSEGFLGGTTQAVIRRSKQSEFRRGPFLLAYDASSSAREALRISAELAKLWETPCHIVYVSNPPEEEILNEAINCLKTKQVPFFSHLVQDSFPVSGILNTAKEIKAELIVMGAFGKNRLYEWLLGSNTRSVIHESTYPVLLTRLN